MRKAVCWGMAVVAWVHAGAPLSCADEILRRVERLSKQVTPSVVEWRRDFHAHPELSNREERTARVVAEHLRKMGVDEIVFDDYGPMTFNDPELGRRMTPSLARAAGEKNVVETEPVMGGEDFSQYAQKVPGFYLFLGVRNEAVGAIHAPHTPDFTVDEAALPIGVRAHVLLALDYLRMQSEK